MIFHVHSSYIASKFFKIFIWIPYLLAAAIWSENFNFFFTINFFESKLLTFLNLFLPSCFFSGKIKLGKFEKQPQPCLMSSTVSSLSFSVTNKFAPKCAECAQKSAAALSKFFFDPLNHFYCIFMHEFLSDVNFFLKKINFISKNLLILFLLCS